MYKIMSISVYPFAQDMTVSTSNTFTGVQTFVVPADVTVYVESYIIGPDCAYKIKGTFRNAAQIGSTQTEPYVPNATYNTRFTISANSDGTSSLTIQVQCPTTPANYSVYGNAYVY